MLSATSSSSLFVPPVRELKTELRINARIAQLRPSLGMGQDSSLLPNSRAAATVDATASITGTINGDRVKAQRIAP
jgi:hypothetical protein